MDYWTHGLVSFGRYKYKGIHALLNIKLEKLLILGLKFIVMFLNRLP